MTSMHRRRLLGAAAALPFAQAGIAQELPLTPACGPQSPLTPRQTEGPYYTPHTPQRGSLVEPGSRAERLVLAGRVVSPSCQPVAKALLDFWQCDENGSYDNVGFRYRGHLFSDADGRFRLETIVPAIYPGRARHIHVKVQAPGRRILTTQLYFPGDARDWLWRPELVVSMEQRPQVRAAAFQFIVDAGKGHNRAWQFAGAHHMTYIVTEDCIKCKHMDCIEVCPVDCFYEGENMLVIHPDECIDCGVCEPECPPGAILPDSDPKAERWLKLNTEFSLKWPNITRKGTPPTDADAWKGVPDKFAKYFTPEPGKGE